MSTLAYVRFTDSAAFALPHYKQSCAIGGRPRHEVRACAAASAVRTVVDEPSSDAQSASCAQHSSYGVSEGANVYSHSGRTPDGFVRCSKAAQAIAAAFSYVFRPPACGVC